MRSTAREQFCPATVWCRCKMHKPYRLPPRAGYPATPFATVHLHKLQTPIHNGNGRNKKAQHQFPGIGLVIILYGVILKYRVIGDFTVFACFCGLRWFKFVGGQTRFPANHKLQFV